MSAEGSYYFDPLGAFIPGRVGSAIIAQTNSQMNTKVAFPNLIVVFIVRLFYDCLGKNQDFCEKKVLDIYIVLFA